MPQNFNDLFDLSEKHDEEKPASPISQAVPVFTEKTPSPEPEQKVEHDETEAPDLKNLDPSPQKSIAQSQVSKKEQISIEKVEAVE